VREPRQVEAEVVRRRWLAAPARDGVRVWPNSLVRDDARAWRGTGGTRPHQHGSMRPGGMGARTVGAQPNRARERANPAVREARPGTEAVRSRCGHGTRGLRWRDAALLVTAGRTCSPAWWLHRGRGRLSDTGCCQRRRAACDAARERADKLRPVKVRDGSVNVYSGARPEPTRIGRARSHHGSIQRL
jgi:hypothetical protein